VLIAPVAIDEIDWRHKYLRTTVTQQQVRHSPPADTTMPVSRQHEVEQYGYYGFPYPWSGAGAPALGQSASDLASDLNGSDSPGALRAKELFVRVQAQHHRDRGDDPHLRSYRAVDRYHVHAMDGDIGHVEGLIVDDDDWTIRYLVVNTSDWWLGHKVLVSPQWIEQLSWLEATVTVGVTRQKIREAPPYDELHLPARVLEEELFRHHARPGYWMDSQIPHAPPPHG
jgi:hypothetical protein